MRCASVDTRIGSGDFLQHQTLVGNDDFFGNVVTQLLSILSPSDFVRRWTGPDATFKVDIIALLDIRGVEATAQIQRRTWHVYE